MIFILYTHTLYYAFSKSTNLSKSRPLIAVTTISTHLALLTHPRSSWRIRRSASGRAWYANIGTIERQSTPIASRIQPKVTLTSHWNQVSKGLTARPEVMHLVLTISPPIWASVLLSILHSSTILQSDLWFLPSSSKIQRGLKSFARITSVRANRTRNRHCKTVAKPILISFTQLWDMWMILELVVYLIHQGDGRSRQTLTRPPLAGISSSNSQRSKNARVRRSSVHLQRFKPRQ